MEFKKAPLLFSNYPLPPSDNNIKLPIRRYKKGSHGAQILTFAKTRDYQVFERDVLLWSFHLKSGLTDAVDEIQKWLSQKYVLGMHVEFHFHKSRIITQKDLPKKFDHTNRLKALHDTLSTLLRFDDSWLFNVSTEKTVVSEAQKECAEILIGPVELKILGEIPRELATP